MSQVSGKSFDLKQKYAVDTSVFTKEQIDKLNWELLATESLDAIDQLRDIIQNPMLKFLKKETLIQHFINHKDLVLNTLLPLQAFLLRQGITNMVIENPKCLTPQKSG